MLLWPSVTVLGFLALAGLVVALGRSSTARFEFQRNHVQSERQPAVAGASVPHAAVQSGDDRRTPARAGGGTVEAAPERAVAVAAHPAGSAPVPGWWLLDGAADEPAADVLAG